MNKVDVRIDDLDNECLAYDGNKVNEIAEDKYHCCTVLIKAIQSPHGNEYTQLQTFRKYVPKLLDLLYGQTEVIKDLNKVKDRLTNAMYSKNRKKWTPEEDDTLIELASKEKTTIVELSSYFGRSPGAISSRLSQLIGISRTTQEIVGRFVGCVDGEEVAGNINGTIYKDVK